MADQCKITVLRREYYQDLADAYLADPATGKCPLFQEGQTFLVDESHFSKFTHDGRFCQWAWDCISHLVYVTIIGGRPFRVGWSKDPKYTICCCNDGARPVIFKLEAVEAEEPPSSPAQ